MELQCIECGTEFERKSKKGPKPKYCPGCKRLRNLHAEKLRKRDRRSTVVNVSCQVCGSKIPETTRADSKTCSDGCRSIFKSDYKSEFYSVESNRKQKNSTSRKYYQENREKASESGKKYYERNRDKILSYQKKYYSSNRDHLLELAKQYASSRKSEKSEYDKRYRLSHVDERRERNMKRRASKMNVSLEHFTRAAIYERDNGVCYICSEDVDPKDFHIDHLVPLSAGGAHNQYNVAIAHPYCNIVKGSKIIEIAIEKRAKNMMESLMLAVNQ